MFTRRHTVLRPLHFTRALLLAALAGGTTLTVACTGGGSTGPSLTPTAPPSGAPTANPSSSAKPSSAPSGSPSSAPSGSPTGAPTAAPTAIDASHVAFVVQVDPGAVSAAPNVTPSAVNIYIVGSQAVSGGKCPATVQYVSSASGTLTTLAGTATAAPIPFYGNGTTSGNASQVIQLPALCSGRIYIATNGTLALTAGTQPAPWASSGPNGSPTKFDIVEYTTAAGSQSIDVDTTQENMIGLDITAQLNGSKGTQTIGLKAGAMSYIDGLANNLPAPWAAPITNQWPTRLLSPLSLQYVINGTGNASLPGFNPGTFLDGAILTEWQHYQSPNCMSLTVSTGTGDALAGQKIVGQVDTAGTFNFYAPSVACGAHLATNQAGNIVAQIPAVYNNVFYIQSSLLGGWYAATGAELLENGPFLLNTTYPSTLGTTTFTQTYPTSSAAIGNVVATALNRGIFDPAANAAYASQPYCPGIANVYPASGPDPAQNLWATIVWQAARNPSYGYGSAYAIPYDDQCGYSTNLTDSSAKVLTATIFAN